jgi:predicted extracellular nuclease
LARVAVAFLVAGAVVAAVPTPALAVPTLADVVDQSVDEGIEFSGQVATYSAADGTETATIDWGDGTVDSCPADCSITGGGAGQISGAHTYVDDGVETVTVTVTDGTGQVSDSFTMTVGVSPSAR